MGRISLSHKGLAIMMTEQEFWDILHNVPKTHPVFFRLYYDESGAPITYTMEDLPGNYIEIDAATFALGPLNVRVRNGKLVEIVTLRSQKLVPGAQGTACHPQDVAVIVTTAPATHWNKQLYESN
jgi:hypothetical protein